MTAIPGTKNLIVGIDPGTKNLGLAALTVQHNLLVCVSTSLVNVEDSVDGVEHVFGFTESVLERIDDKTGYVIHAMERFFMPRMSKTHREIIKMEGVLEYWARHEKYPADRFALVNAPSMKHLVAGSGKASKAEVADELKKLIAFPNINIDDMSEHEYDALGCAYYIHGATQEGYI